MSARASRPAWIAYGVLLALSLVLLVAVGLPFWEPLLFALVLTAALTRLHEKLASKLRGRRRIAAWIVTIGVIFLVLAPVASVVILGVQQAAAGVEFVREAIAAGKLPQMADSLPGPLGKWARRGLETLPEQLAKLRELATPEKGMSTVAAVGGALSATGRILLKSVLMLIALYFLLIDGKRLRNWLIEIAPMREGQTARLLREFAVVAKSVLGSMLVSAVSQGAAATIGYLIARVPQPFFFGLLTFFMAFIPSIGTGAVGLPVGIILLLTGRPVAGIFVIAWTLLVVGLIDNVFKPLFIKGKVDIHGAVIFFALLGGLALLGPMGLVVGPLAVSFFLAMVRMGSPAEPQIERVDSAAAKLPLPEPAPAAADRH